MSTERPLRAVDQTVAVGIGFGVIGSCQAVRGGLYDAGLFAGT